MKQKRKLGRKLLSFLLTLAMLVGLVPGMGVTAYAATSHGITINTAQHGTVTASVNGSAATSAEEGATITLTANPDNGYRLKSISGTYKGNPQETKGLNGTKTINGTYFNLSATDAAGAGWSLKNNSTITITSKDSSVKIDKVDFNIQFKGGSFNLNNVSCSAGTKSLNGNTLSVSSINGTTVTLSSSANSAGTVRLNSVTIYGTGAVDTNLSISTTGDVNVRTFTMPAVVQGDVTITPVFEEIPKYSVNITPGSNMTKTAGSGDAEQTGLSGAMTDVVYTADNGYYFPTDYSVAEVSGIKVTRNSYTQITVSGTPSADATITLTAPTAKTTPTAPTTAAATDCTTADNNDGKLTGVTAAMEYKKSDAADWTAGTGSNITGLVPGTYYVRVKATETTNASTNQELTIKGFISYTVTFKVVNGKWNEGEGDAATTDKTVTLTGHDGDTLKLTADQIPAVGTKPNDTYKAGNWDTTPSTDTEITGATTYTYTYAQKDSISQTVTFKVVNGKWDDDTTADKTVTLTGYEGDTLKLAANQIPAIGSKPNDTYKAGSWDVTPSADTEITGATTYTYTYAQKDSISQTVTFKVVNGSWNDETTTDKTVTLTGYEGDTLKLAADQIPTVGTKPNDTYKAGSWDVTPSTDTAITAATTNTYTYAAKEASVVTKAPTAKTLTYTGSAQALVTAGEATGGTMYYAVTTENTAPTDDNLYTTSIPTKTEAGTYFVWYKAVGDDSHNDSAAACVTVSIQSNNKSYVVTFKVVNGAWDNGVTADSLETLIGPAGTALKLTAEQIPAVGKKPNDGYKEGSWDVTPSTETEITADTVYTYTYAKKETITISRTVTFKVVNGAWDDGTTADKTVTLSGEEGATLKLTADQIPGASSKPNENYQAGSWDTTPSTEDAITSDITYTYSYTAKETDPQPQPQPQPTPSEGATETEPQGDAQVNVSVLDRETEKGIIEAAGGTVSPTDDIKIILVANNKSEAEVTKDAEAVKKAVKNAGVTIGGFVDVTLGYTINNGAITPITDSSAPVTFFVPVPASMIGNDRIYIVYCIHWDPATGTVSITEVGRSTTPTVPVSSDKFSTYAIGYTTAPKASKATEPTHTHVYEWTVTREATESDDGCMAYACKICGDTLYQVPISAYYTFNKSTMEKIQKAPQGATVSIVTDRWISFHKMVLEALNKRPDVTLKVSFLDGEYRGDVRSFTIPAGTDAASFAADSNFAGFMYIASKVGFDN